MERPWYVKIPCGVVTGHGECCCEDYMCGSCQYIVELERKVFDQECKGE